MCIYMYLLQIMSYYENCTKKAVSISILTEDEAGGFFYNIVFTALFNLFVHVNLHVLYFN
jgi:hypothetical protein